MTLQSQELAVIQTRFEVAAAVSNRRRPQLSCSIQSLANMRVILLLLAVTMHLQGELYGIVPSLLFALAAIPQH